MKFRFLFLLFNAIIAPRFLSAESGEAFIKDLSAGLSTGLPFLVRVGIAAALVILQLILVSGIFHLAKLSRKKIHSYSATKLKAVKFKSLVILEPRHIITIGCFFINIIKYLLVILQLAISIPIVLGLFEKTRYLAKTLLGYILEPVKNFALGFIHYIPNLITIIISILIARYALRGLKFFSTQIEKQKLVIPGFYPEWAQPTFNILRVLLIAFTVAIIYPNLPNSESEVFKGVSVLVGVIFSLGSSSVVGNLISGIVMTYMRPFKVGDRIKINDVTGFVIERSAMVVRVRTHKNEIISFPNQMIMNNAVTNYTAPAECLDGYIVNTCVTFGYSTSWQTVHKILLEAAAKTIHAEVNPPAFVNQIKLDDFYCWYEINFYTKKPEFLPAIYSDLYKNIQNGFVENGLSLYAPHFHVEKRINDNVDYYKI